MIRPPYLKVSVGLGLIVLCWNFSMVLEAMGLLKRAIPSTQTLLSSKRYTDFIGTMYKDKLTLLEDDGNWKIQQPSWYTQPFKKLAYKAGINVHVLVNDFKDISFDLYASDPVVRQAAFVQLSFYYFKKYAQTKPLATGLSELIKVLKEGDIPVPRGQEFDTDILIRLFSLITPQTLTNVEEQIYGPKK